MKTIKKSELIDRLYYQNGLLQFDCHAVTDIHLTCESCIFNEPELGCIVTGFIVIGVKTSLKLIKAMENSPLEVLTFDEFNEIRKSCLN